VEEAEEDMAVLIRAHGIPRDVEKDLRQRCSHVEDATCPRVKKAQLAIAEATASGRVLLLYGEAEHPEVKGLISYSATERYIFSSMEELLRILPQMTLNRPVVLAAQTTQDRQIFDEMQKSLYRYFGNNLLVLDTICDATRQRQQEAGTLAEKVQCMVVVGGKTSGNTRRLAELARMRGVAAVLVETAEELDPSSFVGLATVGLTAGASTPRYIIDAVESKLKSW
jgi:4-hydroxy-3-methylbut-2-enyl diphosphate reductase